MLIIQGPNVGTIGGTVAETEQEFLFNEGTLKTLPLPVDPAISVPVNTRSVRFMSTEPQVFEITVITNKATYYIQGILSSLAFGTTSGEFITSMDVKIIGIGGFVGVYFSPRFRVRNSPMEWNL